MLYRAKWDARTRKWSLLSRDGSRVVFRGEQHELISALGRDFQDHLAFLDPAGQAMLVLPIDLLLQYNDIPPWVDDLPTPAEVRRLDRRAARAKPAPERNPPTKP